MNEESLVLNLAKKEEVFKGVPMDHGKGGGTHSQGFERNTAESIPEEEALGWLRAAPLRGEDDGDTLERALKEVGGDKTRLVEIDVKRGPRLYASLTHAVLNGLILGAVGGPNCRTRSVLRHYPLPAGRQGQ